MVWTTRLNLVPDIDAAIDFARDVTVDLRGELGSQLVAVYLHGSSVLGDFDPLLSDIDLLGIVDDNTPVAAVMATADVLRAPRTCPAQGIEASVVAAGAANRPRQPWPFVVHVTTDDDHKVVFGYERDGDDDLILHYAVTRAAGLAIDGPPAPDVIGEIDAAVIIEQLRGELIWATRHASGPYTVLNACRALRYDRDRVICSKTDGGLWALKHGIAPEVVTPALAARRSSTTYPLDPASESWVLSVAESLRRSSS